MVSKSCKMASKNRSQGLPEASWDPSWDRLRFRTHFLTVFSAIVGPILEPIWVPFGIQFLTIFWEASRRPPKRPLTRFGVHLASILPSFWEPFSGPCPKWLKREFAAIYYTSATSGSPLELKKVTFSRFPFDSPPGGLPILSFYINLWILNRFWGSPGSPFSILALPFFDIVF